ncbi:MAG: PH domain-containing protein [Parcubacteria group bacterium]
MQLETLQLEKHEGEQIIMIVRRHWFNILQNLLSVLIMAGFLVASFLYFPFLFPSLSQHSLNGLFLFGETVFAMMIWIVFSLILIDYYFDVWIVTTRRIINVEQKGLFSREVSELKLEKIQDISTEVLGVIPTFLNYGDVYIQTAAEQERFLFRRVPDPYRIKDIIMGLQKKHEHEATEEFREIIQNKPVETPAVPKK